MAINKGLNYPLPMYALFILVLIISGNYIGELLPCQVQAELSDNILLKHFFAYLTLFFFVGLTDSEIAEKGFGTLLFKTMLIYFVFLIFIKNNVTYFQINLFLLGILYLVNYVRLELKAKYDDEDTDDDTKNKLEGQINALVTTSNVIWIISLIILIIGFLVYMGQKKCEYYGSFDYGTFFFGKASCKGATDVEIGHWDAMGAAFGSIPDVCTNEERFTSKVTDTTAKIPDTTATVTATPLISATSDSSFNLPIAVPNTVPVSTTDTLLKSKLLESNVNTNTTVPESNTNTQVEPNSGNLGNSFNRKL